MKVEMFSKDLFQTRVYTFNLGLESHHDAWIRHIENLRKNSPEPPSSRSVRNGWKADFKVFENPIFDPLNQVAKGCFEHVFQQESVVNLQPFKLHGSVNITDPGGFNMQHGHAGALYSGCYYVRVPENSGDITFHDPRPGAVYSPLKSKQSFGSLQVLFTPQEGQLVLFPSWLEHSVQPNDSDVSRISIPINADIASMSLPGAL